MNSEWRDMAAYVARLEREREELRAALSMFMDAYDRRRNSSGTNTWEHEASLAARRALSSGERTEGGR